MHIDPVSVTFGCDPEFFFERAGKVIGSEKVIPLEGGLGNPGYGYTQIPGTTNKIIVDGVQAEINPKPHVCRANLANEIAACFRTLVAQMKKDPTVSINFSPSVKVSKEELASLDETSRRLGCAPSLNVDKTLTTSIKLKSAARKLHRSAGGHVHLGCNLVKEYPERCVVMLDVILGNISVLIDRDPANVERRKLYGQAGEYRLPPHGLEYRTLSNFWLKAYPLMSLVMGLARYSLAMVSNNLDQQLLALVNIDDVRKAINTNDYELAYANFQKIKQFICDHGSYWGGDTFPLDAGRMPAFECFISKPLEYWWSHDPVQHWANLPEAHTGGWETFIDNRIPRYMSDDAAQKLQMQKVI